MKRLAPFLALLLAFVLAACDTVDSDPFEEQYVVEAYLIANEPLRQVRVSRTSDLDATYRFEDVAVSDAQVEVQLLTDGGQVEARYMFVEMDTKPGVYVPLQAEVVLPLRRYRLEIATPAGDAISGETRVPGAFEILNDPAESLVYQSTAQLELVVTRSSFPGRDQAYFTVVTEALDPQADQLVPFAADLYDEGEGDFTLEDFVITGSPPFNEANFDINPDNTLTIRYPWIGISFYGPNRIRLSAIDDNLYDFLRSVGIQQGGSTFSPGEIPDVINHISGGIGIFGSYARVEYDLMVLPE